ncbi:MAG: DsbA family oxidoreductase [Thermomicrobiales bacterium]
MATLDKTRTRTTAIPVDLFEDFICPWCRIGRSNLRTAADRWNGGTVEVRHRPFLLDPEIPPEGYDYRAYLNYKFGGNADRVNDAVLAAGKSAGVTFDFARVRFLPNTIAAHMLVDQSPAAVREKIVDDLYTAHWVEMRNIGDLEVLADIAERHGVDPRLARTLNFRHPARKQVAESMREAQQLGITGVPFFVFDNQFGVSGAQPPDTLVQVLRMTTENEGM